MNDRFRVVCLACLVGCGSVDATPQDASMVDAPPITSCTPNEFVDCDGTVARTCNSAGTGSVNMECGAPGCNASAMRCNECEPGAVTCSGNDLQTCSPEGVPTSVSCVLGCNASPTAHCGYIQPSYTAISNVCDALATIGVYDVTANTTLDTSQTNNCTGGVMAQVGGPDICVMRHTTLTVAAGATLSVTGSRAIAFITDGAVTINGTIDVGGKAATSGPGGGATSSGGASGADSGGGGAGFATAGGNGAGASNAGPVGVDPSTLTFLVGGPKATASNFVNGGGGGGVLALISCRGVVTIAATGIIDAGGGGGPGGVDPVVDDSGAVHYSAGGGGAGGNIVLEGNSISVLGQIFANGGGGGGGTSVDETGNGGANGSRSTTVSASGGPAMCGGNSGGPGARQGTAAGAGSSTSIPGSCSSGGGGGSIGFAQTYTPTGVTPTLTPSAASPTFSSNKTLTVR